MTDVFDLREQPDNLCRALDRVARRTGHPPEAVFLVLYAIAVAGRGLSDDWWTATDGRRIPEDVPTQHLTAVEVCDAVCRCARARAPEAAWRVLRLWGLRTGADIGRIVYALVAEGLGSAAADDRADDFVRIPLRRLLNPVREDHDED